MAAEVDRRPASVHRQLQTFWKQLTILFVRWPWFVQVLTLFALTRVFSLCVFLGVAAKQGVSPWGDAQPSYFDFVGIWDSDWYERIYVDGYPREIPRDELGHTKENQWAFYALFPFLVRGLHTVSGAEWKYLAPLTATACALVAAVLIYLLFREKASHRDSLWGVVLVGTFPVSAVLQVPYAESLHLALLAAALLLVVRQQYLAAIPVVILMCLARPAGVPFAAAMAVLWIYRWWKRRDNPFPARLSVRLAALVVVSGFSALAWPIIAWLYTGELAAYTDTETAWRGQGLTLFLPWVEAGQGVFGPIAGAIAPVLLAIFAALYLCSPTVRRLGIEIQLWSAAYLLYLLAFLHPQTSTFRLLLPLFPLALAAVFLSPSRAYRGAVVVMFLLLQIVWVAWLWEWTQLPGGGDYPP
ncbi:hypothetical protein [Arthrobacter roseus]|uniref:hypothetical protein n=1 Tax=Arthrobacter roseus TaxID=136274 RepID=UPI001EF7898A|nr:hypothetical protein [Arthrobacter roseus]MBM7849190.1 hypothetical protein [Arthrobacter roseus]